MKTSKIKKPKAIPLAKGQLWKMEDRHVEIMEVGKTLAHYRLFQTQKRVPISLNNIINIQTMLKDNGAKLIRKGTEFKVSDV